jgi:hypothetical protein
MKEKLYTFKSTSSEGTYYLVNGWSKYKTFWVQPERMKKEMLFKKPSDAKRSLTKLLKIMEEYKTDKMELIEI